MLRQHGPGQGEPGGLYPSRTAGVARREAVAFYFSQLAEGLLAGEFGVLTGHETASARPTDALTLEITFTRKPRADVLSVRLRWARPEPPAAALRGPDGQGDPRRKASHPEFTSPSFGRNTIAQNSRVDADDR